MSLLPRPLLNATRLPLPSLWRRRAVVQDWADTRPALVIATSTTEATAATEATEAPDAQAPDAGPGTGPRACGWFDSSFELHQGLAVSECALDDWAAWCEATLDQARLEPSSAQLQ